MKKIKAIVTGGAGFIGSTLARSLIADGHQVLIIDNFSYSSNDNINDLLPGKADLSYLDITNSQAVRKRVQKYQPDYIFHLAAVAPLPDCQSDPYLAYNVNVGGTINVLEAARYSNVKRIVFASTGALYENIAVPHNELSGPRRFIPQHKNLSEVHHFGEPDLTYPTTKYHAEHICNNYIKNYGLNIIKLRLFNVYGVLQSNTRKHPALMGYITKCLTDNLVPQFYNKTGSKRDYVNVKDVVAAFKKSAFIETPITSRHEPSTYNVCSGVQHSVEEILDIFYVCAKHKGLDHACLGPGYQKPAQFWHKYPNLSDATYNLKEERLIKEVEHQTLGSNTLAKTFLGWKPTVSIEEGIKEICDTLIP